MTRPGDWSQTYSGKAFYQLDPREADICIEDIAHSLACQNRYMGHTRAPYSIAQHAFLVSLICDEADAFEGLLHDAAEAYTGDIVRPIKRSVPGIVEFEKNIEEVIARRFGLRYPWSASVLRADNILLATEARDLMAPPLQDWKLSENPLHLVIKPWSWDVAEATFLSRFHTLLSIRVQA